MASMRTVDPAPAEAAGRELCPFCGAWVRIRQTDGNMVVHPRVGTRCSGSGGRSTVAHQVVTRTARFTASGRLNAELIAQKLRTAGGDTIEILAAS